MRDMMIKRGVMCHIKLHHDDEVSGNGLKLNKVRRSRVLTGCPSI